MWKLHIVIAKHESELTAALIKDLLATWGQQKQTVNMLSPLEEPAKQSVAHLNIQRP